MSMTLKEIIFYIFSLVFVAGFQSVRNCSMGGEVQGAFHFLGKYPNHSTSHVNLDGIPHFWLFLDVEWEDPGLELFYDIILIREKEMMGVDNDKDGIYDEFILSRAEEEVTNIRCISKKLNRKIYFQELFLKGTKKLHFRGELDLPYLYLEPAEYTIFINPLIQDTNHTFFEHFIELHGH